MRSESTKLSSNSEKILREKGLIGKSAGDQHAVERLTKPIGSVKQSTLMSIDKPTFQPNISKKVHASSNYSNSGSTPSRPPHVYHDLSESSGPHDTSQSFYDYNESNYDDDVGMGIESYEEDYCYDHGHTSRDRDRNRDIAAYGEEFDIYHGDEEEEEYENDTNTNMFTVDDQHNHLHHDLGDGDGDGDMIYLQHEHVLNSDRYSQHHNFDADIAQEHFSDHSLLYHTNNNVHNNNPNRREGGGDKDTLYNRSQNWLEKKNERIANQQKIKNEEELHECSFRPKIKESTDVHLMPMQPPVTGTHHNTTRERGVKTTVANPNRKKVPIPGRSSSPPADQATTTKSTIADRQLEWAKKR